MLKEAGCILLLASCILAAHARIKDEKDYLDSLASFLDMLELMSGELTARCPSLPELTSYLCKRCNGQAKNFLEHLEAKFKYLGREEFSELWEKATDKAEQLDTHEKMELGRLGKILGRCEVEVQALAIKRTEELFRKELARRRENFPQKRKLDFGLFGGAGIILLIVLI